MRFQDWGCAVLCEIDFLADRFNSVVFVKNILFSLIFFSASMSFKAGRVKLSTPHQLFCSKSPIKTLFNRINALISGWLYLKTKDIWLELLSAPVHVEARHSDLRQTLFVINNLLRQSFNSFHFLLIGEMLNFAYISFPGPIEFEKRWCNECNLLVISY